MTYVATAVPFLAAGFSSAHTDVRQVAPPAATAPRRRPGPRPRLRPAALAPAPPRRTPHPRWQRAAQGSAPPERRRARPFPHGCPPRLLPRPAV